MLLAMAARNTYVAVIGAACSCGHWRRLQHGEALRRNHLLAREEAVLKQAVAYLLGGWRSRQDEGAYPDAQRATLDPDHRRSALS